MHLQKLAQEHYDQEPDIINYIPSLREDFWNSYSRPGYDLIFLISA